MERVRKRQKYSQTTTEEGWREKERERESESE